MDSIKLRKKWSNVEKFLIWVGYHANVPYKRLSEVLGRTLSSMNKVVQRYHIKDKAINPSDDLHDRYMELLESPAASSQWLARTLTESFPEVMHSSPWHIDSEKLISNSAKRIAKAKKMSASGTSDWHNWEEVLDYLKRNEIKISPITIEATGQHGYLIQGKVMNKRQVFLFVNRMRASQGLSPYLVTGITFIQ